MDHVAIGTLYIIEWWSFLVLHNAYIYICALWNDTHKITSLLKVRNWREYCTQKIEIHIYTRASMGNCILNLQAQNVSPVYSRLFTILGQLRHQMMHVYLWFLLNWFRMPEIGKKIMRKYLEWKKHARLLILFGSGSLQYKASYMKMEIMTVVTS